MSGSSSTIRTSRAGVEPRSAGIIIALGAEDLIYGLIGGGVKTFNRLIVIELTI
jgi:hypothetical protein